MRTLLLFRGAPGCGKTRYTKQHELKPFTVSREMALYHFGGPRLTPSGKWSLPDVPEESVHKLMLDLVETRMKYGEFIVVDDCNVHIKSIESYNDLAKAHGYEVYLIDMTDVSMNDCLYNIKQGYSYIDGIQYVTGTQHIYETAVRDAYDVFSKYEDIPSNIHVLSSDTDVKDLLLHIWFKHLDGYRTIHHIGDLSGHFDALEQYLIRTTYDTVLSVFPEPLSLTNDDDYYIFMGNYIGDGPDNDKIVRLLSELSKQPNVAIIESEDIQWLRSYALTEDDTHQDIMQSLTCDKETILKLCNAAVPALCYKYDGKQVIVTHGGISNFSMNFGFIPANQCVYGVGNNTFDMSLSFCKQKPSYIYQIHAHRSEQGWPELIDATQSSNYYNLYSSPGDTEFLQLVEEDKSFHRKLKPVDDVQSESPSTQLSLKAIEDQLDISQYLPVYYCVGFRKCSHLFYTYTGVDHASMRRFCIDPDTHQLVGRGYDVPADLTEDNISDVQFVFPLEVWNDYDGDNCVVGYNSSIDDLVIFEEQTPLDYEYDDGNTKRQKLENLLSMRNRKEILKEYLKEHNCSAVFNLRYLEHPQNLISTTYTNLTLVALVSNSSISQELDIKEVEQLASDLSCRCIDRFETSHLQEGFVEITSLKELKSFIAKVNSTYADPFDDNIRRGFMLKDQRGYRFRIETPAYKTRRVMYDVFCAVLLSHMIPAHAAKNTEAWSFYRWMMLNKDRVNKIRFTNALILYEQSK